jgi:hypothetical protein
MGVITGDVLHFPALSHNNARIVSRAGVLSPDDSTPNTRLRSIAMSTHSKTTDIYKQDESCGWIRK